MKPLPSATESSNGWPPVSDLIKRPKSNDGDRRRSLRDDGGDCGSCLEVDYYFIIQ
jgi:hypothetical protein